MEPERGTISHEAIAHYQDMLRVCHENNLAPYVTYSHFACPRWFGARGSWKSPDATNHCLRSYELSDISSVWRPFSMRRICTN
ncbi:family 1 glycosylhydrolase [Acetobacter lovaniensis]|nr:family 1 glycosylhydrolase [Acetobacter lovaniensis]